jgi:asparagine synthase (glutamine-hydrolysing)
LFLNEFERTEFNQIENFNRKLTADEKQAFFDLNFYLQDDLLVKVDRASMMNSLEVRVPLLDHRIIEFTLNLSTDLKRNGHDSKYLLKQILYDYVPKEFFNRPKWGFSIPMESWLKKELYFLIETHLSKSEIESTGMLNWNYVQTIINRYKKGETYLYNRLWLIIVYQMWRKTFYV